MTADKAKTVAEVVKIALDIVTTIADRAERKKDKRIAEFEAEVATLRGGK